MAAQRQQRVCHARRRLLMAQAGNPDAGAVPTVVRFLSGLVQSRGALT